MKERIGEISKMKNYDKNLYPSIYDAIYEIMDKHLIVDENTPIYSAKALNEVCFFLAENDIKHQYTIIPAPVGTDCDEIISLVWVDGESYGNEVWYSRGKSGPNVYHVHLTVHAGIKELVEDWVSTLALDNMYIDVEDWSIEEV